MKFEPVGLDQYGNAVWSDDSLLIGLRETSSGGGHARRRAEYERAERQRVIRGRGEIAKCNWRSRNPDRQPWNQTSVPPSALWRHTYVDGDQFGNRYVYVKLDQHAEVASPRPWYVRLWRWVTRKGK